MLDIWQGYLVEWYSDLVYLRQRSSINGFGCMALLRGDETIAGTITPREVRLTATERGADAAPTILAATIQGEHRQADLGDIVLQFMTRQLRAPAGAFYVVEHGAMLRRIAGFALASDPPTAFPVGSGLAGESARADRVMDVAVPAEHLRLESALVSSPPQRVVLVPASHNGRVNAVLELALAAPLGPAQHELLERIRGT